MVKKRDISEEEKRLWRDAMRDVTPLTKMKKTLSPPVKKTAPAAPKKSPKEVVVPAKISSGALDPATRARIARGEYKPQARLDLHGFTLENAHSAVEQFIIDHYAKGSRILLVITGKGGKSGQEGILQHDVPHWLSYGRFSRMVAFHTVAHARHGGAGARYVYLTKKR